jgi:hypothetical protein
MGQPLLETADHPCGWGEPGELKHLSTPRNRKDSRSSGERTGRSPNHFSVSRLLPLLGWGWT